MTGALVMAVAVGSRMPWGFGLLGGLERLGDKREWREHVVAVGLNMY